jgi:hypothetical protein
MKKPRWTPDEIATAKRLIEEGATDEQCVAAVGRNRHTCWTKLYNERNRGYSAFFNHIPSAKPKPEMLADAKQRALAPRTISAFVLGDPPFGYSALDRREERI